MEKQVLAAEVWKEKHEMNHKPVLLKASIIQRRINKLRKYPNKKKNLIINFEIPSPDHLTRKFILNPARGQYISFYKKSKFGTVDHGLTMKMVFEKTPLIFK